MIPVIAVCHLSSALDTPGASSAPSLLVTGCRYCCHLSHSKLWRLGVGSGSAPARGLRDGRQEPGFEPVSLWGRSLAPRWLRLPRGHLMWQSYVPFCCGPARWADLCGTLPQGTGPPHNLAGARGGLRGSAAWWWRVGAPRARVREVAPVTTLGAEPCGLAADWRGLLVWTLPLSRTDVGLHQGQPGTMTSTTPSLWCQCIRCL